jgi:hypothetical protein
MGPRGYWVEELEGRMLFSGNIGVTFEDGLLLITGDDAANTVYVQRTYEDPDPSAIEVHGRDGTLINGVSPGGPFRFSGVRAIEVRTNDGDDEIHFIGLRLQGGINIDSGAGEDAVYIRKSRVLGNTVMRSGHHADALTVADTFFGNDLVVDGPGRLPASLAFRLRPFGFTVLPFRFVQLLSDTRGATTVSLRDSVFSDNLSIVTGPADDRLTMNNCWVEGFSGFNMGDGDDFISIDNGTELKRATVLDDGEGDDQVYHEVVKRFDFDNGKQGWEGYFSNYPAGQVRGHDFNGRPQLAEEVYQLESGIRELPSTRPTQSRAFMLSGINGTDAMLFFIGRTFGQTDGLLPGVTYQLELEFRYSALGSHLARTLAGALLSGPIQFGWEQKVEFRTLHVLGSDGGDFAERAGEVELIAPLSEGVHHLSHVLRHQVRLDTALSVLVALKNAHEDGATIFFESVSVRFVPVANSSVEANPAT